MERQHLEAYAMEALTRRGAPNHVVWVSRLLGDLAMIARAAGAPPEKVDEAMEARIRDLLL